MNTGKKIVYYANKEVHERLVRALEQTDFKEWSAEHGYKTPDYDRGVVQYLKIKSDVKIRALTKIHYEAYNGIICCIIPKWKRIW